MVRLWQAAGQVGARAQSRAGGSASDQPLPGPCSWRPSVPCDVLQVPPYSFSSVRALVEEIARITSCKFQVLTILYTYNYIELQKGIII